MSLAYFFPASIRAIDQSPKYRRYSLLASIIPAEVIHFFPGFQKLNDLTLAAEYEYKSVVSRTGQLILLPTVGNIKVDFAGLSLRLEAGQLIVLPVLVGALLSITNQSKAELCNYIEIWLWIDNIKESPLYVHNLDLDKINELTTWSLNDRFSFSIGKFQGRMTGELNTEDNTTVLVYIINGVFEFQNRLMETGDGLALYIDENNLKFEALAQESILIILTSKV